MTNKQSTGTVDAKLMYELAKLTNTARQITDDFIETITLTMFKDFLNSKENGKEFLAAFLNIWEDNLLQQKELELDILTNQDASMIDMATGVAIANTEDVLSYKKELSDIKALLSIALSGE